MEHEFTKAKKLKAENFRVQLINSEKLKIFTAVLIQRYSLPFSSNQLLTTYDHVTYSGFYALIYLDFSNVRLLAFLIQTAFEHHVKVIDAADHVTHFDDHETDYVDDPRETGIWNSHYCC